MKYNVGEIVCLNDGRMVYIFAVDKNEKKYQVSDTEYDGTLFNVKDEEIFMKLI